MSKPKELMSKKITAKRMVRDLLTNGFSQADIARKEGLSQQAVSARFNSKAVQTELQAALRKVGITIEYKARKFRELLEAKKLQGEELVEVNDNLVRLGALKLVCQIDKDIDCDEDKKGNVKIINIVHGYRKEDKLEDKIKETLDVRNS